MITQDTQRKILEFFRGLVHKNELDDFIILTFKGEGGGVITSVTPMEAAIKAMETAARNLSTRRPDRHETIIAETTESKKVEDLAPMITISHNGDVN
jgi:hypothetical protein